MKSQGLIVVLAAALVAAPSVFAQQAPASTPAGATGQCKDGSYTSQAGKRGACRGHQGVKTWYAAASSTPSAATPPAAAAKSATVPPGAGHAARSMAWTQPAAKAAPGGGPGKVWIHAGSKVYHCPGDKWYGRTRQGKYMGEDAARAKGYHGPRGKTCTA